MPKYKKILTMDDLVKFCQEQSYDRFNSQVSGYQLAVKIPTTFEEVESVDDNHRGMMKLKFRIFHTELNRNNSYVSKEAAEDAMKTIADRPILAAIHQLDNGEWDFESHEMEIVTNDEGESELHYIESQVGSFSSEPAFWEHDDELNKDYVCAYGYISTQYTKAAEIIQRKNGTKNSCELVIDEMAYNAQDKYLDLIKFYVNGSTLLGAHDDGTEIQEGMVGSRADIAEFSVDNNSVQYSQNENLIQIIQELKQSLDNYIAKENSKKGGQEMLFDELCKQYGVTVDDIEFEYEGLSDEELKSAFAEAFADEGEDPAEEGDPEPGSDPESEEDEKPEDDSDDENKIVYSVSIDGKLKEFSLSLNDQIYALQTLVNDTYGDADNDWYTCEVYDDEKVVVMHGWCRSFRQSYKVKKDTFSLVGDRVEVFAKWLTEDEISKLDAMKANYAVLEDKVQRYESEPDKIEIIESSDYDFVRETDEFAKLSTKESLFDLSVDEVKTKADEILLNYVKAGNFKVNEKPVAKKMFAATTKKTGRYGNIFSK